MRSVPLLLLCLPLAACAAGGSFPVAAPAPETPAPVAASPSSSGGAHGGATTAAARAAADPDAPNPTDDPVIQARADCWMKVETQRGLRSIDQRTAFVDKCVAEQIKAKPSP